MRNVILLIAIVIIAFMWGYHNGNLADKQQRELINAYELYKSGAEALLDSISTEYSWVDYYDVDDYCDGLHKVDSLSVK